MANVMQAAPPTTTRSAGRLYFWLGIGLCLLGPILNMILMQMGQLGLPWYALVLSTVGVGLLLFAVIRRAGIGRIVFLVLFGLLCAFGWFFVVFMSRLPAYEGPARAGDKLPAFTTKLADDSPFTQKDLETGQPSVLVFYRGRW